MWKVSPWGRALGSRDEEETPGAGILTWAGLGESGRPGGHFWAFNPPLLGELRQVTLLLLASEPRR